MKDHFSDMGRYVSIFDRLMKMYYDRSLCDYEIGWGQQFYVEYLYEHPGATPQEMASCIRVDKGTLSKTIKKLDPWQKQPLVLRGAEGKGWRSRSPKSGGRKKQPGRPNKQRSGQWT